MLAQAGAALVIKQKDLTPEKLASLISELAAHRERRARMGECARALGRPQASGTVAVELARMAGFEIQHPLSKALENDTRVQKRYRAA